MLSDISPRFATTTTPLLVAFLLLLSSSSSLQVVSAFRSPETTGPYVTGVRDAEFTDHRYPSVFPIDAQGRRIMFRVWYPVCNKSDLSLTTVNGNQTTATAAAAAAASAICSASASSDSESIDLGRRRRYFEPGEWEAYFGGQEEPIELTQTYDLTQSYLDAPSLGGGFPVVIYTHGYGTWVSDNTALLEQIASYGYTVMAIGSPGFASGVLYPNDQHVTMAAIDYPEINVTMMQGLELNPFMPPVSDDLQVRFDRTKEYLEMGGTASLNPRVRDDMLALADHIDSLSSKELEASSSTTTKISSSSSSSTTTTTTTTTTTDDTFLKQLIGSTTDGLDKVVYMGFSFGGAAAGSAAHADPRAVGAINLDGLHSSLDLLGNDIRVPLLHFQSNTALTEAFPFNEFFFESLDTMGSRPDITRVLSPKGVAHQDISDFMMYSQEVRHAFLNTTWPLDGDNLHAILAEFCIGFLGSSLGNGASWNPKESFDMFPDIESIDVSYLAEWRQSTLDEEEEQEKEDIEEDSDLKEQDDSSLSSSSSALAMMAGWLPQVSIGVSLILLFQAL